MSVENQTQVKAFKKYVQGDYALKTTRCLLCSHASFMFLKFTLNEILKQKDRNFKSFAGLAQVVFTVSDRMKDCVSSLGLLKADCKKHNTHTLPPL